MQRASLVINAIDQSRLFTLGNKLDEYLDFLELGQVDKHCICCISHGFVQHSSIVLSFDYTNSSDWTMASGRNPTNVPIGSSSWIQNENDQLSQFFSQEAEDFSFAARNELEWLNEHMADIFTNHQV